MHLGDLQGMKLRQLVRMYRKYVGLQIGPSGFSCLESDADFRRFNHLPIPSVNAANCLELGAGGKLSLDGTVGDAARVFDIFDGRDDCN